MATKVKTNMGAIRSLGTLNKNARAAQKNLRKVSTGERINAKWLSGGGFNYALRIPNS